MRMIRRLLALGRVLASPAGATDVFVDTDGFDRSAWEAAAGDVTDEPFDNDIPQADVLGFDSGIQSTSAASPPGLTASSIPTSTSCAAPCARRDRRRRAT